ncbi:alpha/beta hydrolase [Erythrobacter sp. Alg231-14]|uniref:alpha/beta hydrolase n=1 Tax=Erythrobacter sp. Alg231-14 TaxID=1922225 RepID=UPI00307B1CA6
MKLRPLILSVLGLTLSACVTYPDISQSRSPCRMEAGGWCAFVRDAAVDAYPYAIAATNAYTGDDDLYEDIGPTMTPLDRLDIAEEDTNKGFGYELFAQFAEGTDGDTTRVPVARIMAFRGTDFDGFTDIFYGTLRNDQIDLALKYFEAEQAREEFSDDIPWIVVGHSLGGALATEVSMKHPEVRAYMFNTSPFYGGDAMTNDVRRTVFNERGEVLRRFAKYDAAPAADVFTLNCGPENGSFTKHKIRPLADCIVWIAAYGDNEAGEVVQANGVMRPMVECGDANKPHPGAEYRPTEPCAHRARRDDSDNEDSN